MRAKRLLTGTIALLLGGFVSLHAQDPSARVARASYLQGEVSFRPGTVNDWTSATLNYPLTTGDHLWTDTASRAELQIGANAIRLGPETAFEILSLDDNRLQVRLSQGIALVRVRSLDNDDVEIDTPTGAVSLIRTGTYRIDVSPDGATSTVTVRVGDAEVTTNNSTVTVDPQTTARFTADGASPDVRGVAPMDDYDQWAAARDRSAEESASAQYVSRDMTGYADLDANGSWDNDPDYGHVWIPTHVVSDWAPYRYGRWAWVEPWGWTWIDDAPWGFAPFHYGRWAYVRNRWVWAPGIIVRRPVYAPALVAFVGGSHFTISAGFGSGGGVAWFPLAPGEVYRPAYRASDRYVRNVNITNVHVTNIDVTNVNVTNIQYRNQRVAGAVTAVPNDAFAGSRSIGRRAVVVPVNEASSAHVVGDGAPVTPTRQSILVRRNTTSVARPPEQVITRHVVSKNLPPPRPATFDSHSTQLRTSGDRPVTPVPVSETRGAPRVQANRPMSHTDQPARATTPNTNARPVSPIRPNVNVQPYPRTQPSSSVRPNVNVRAPSSEQPTARTSEPGTTPVATERRAPATPTTHAAPATQSREPVAEIRARRQPEVRPNAEVRSQAPEQEKAKSTSDDGKPSRHG